MTAHDFGAHCVFYHRYHIVWATKYRYKVLSGDVRERARKIIRQTCDELGVTIVQGVLARDHVHMFMSVPPKHAISDVMRRIKGRSSRRLQQEFPISRSATGGATFGLAGTSARPAETSLTTSYFSTLPSTTPMLPTSVGSRSLCESSVVAGRYEQLGPYEVQDHKLVCLQ